MKATPKPSKSLKGLAEQGTDTGVSKSVTTFFVDLDKLEVVEGFNARPINSEHVAELKAAKKDGAVFPPYVVFVENGHVKVIEGHHRRIVDLELKAEAHEGDPMRELRAQCIEFKGSDVERLMLMVGSAQTLQLTPLQMGVQYKKAVTLGWPVARVASRIGKSAQHVHDMIALASSNSDVQEMVTRGEVSASTALAVVKEFQGDAGQVLAKTLETVKKDGGAKVMNKHLKAASSKTALSVKEFDKLLNELCEAVMDANGSQSKAVQSLFDKVCAAFAAAKGAK